MTKLLIVATQAIQRQTTTEILKAIGAKRIATPTKMGDHHLVCGADFRNDSQRALVAVLSVGNGHEYLKLIHSTYDLRSEADFFIGRAGDYYELDAIQLAELDAALSGERA